jgi:hypothetical protein
MFTPVLLSVTMLVALAPIVEAGALEIKCDKAADAIKVTVEGGKTILSVTSKSGIGGATIERKAEQWPKELVLRLHLRGLEAFAITSGSLRLTTSVRSHDGTVNRLQVRKDNGELPVDKASPYWMDIQAFDAQGKPIKGLPKEGGWFEMTVPKGLLGDGAKAITLGWIDFYRH